MILVLLLFVLGSIRDSFETDISASRTQWSGAGITVSLAVHAWLSIVGPLTRRCFKCNCTLTCAQLRSCSVKVEVAVLGSPPSLIVFMVSENVKKH